LEVSLKSPFEVTSEVSFLPSDYFILPFFKGFYSINNRSIF
jgi:hypothetical protein